MADSESGAGSGRDFPPCPPEVCGNPQIQQFIARYCHDMKFPPGTPVPVVYDGKVCYCDCGGATEAGDLEGAAVPPCSGELCQELRPQIEQACHDLGYPPGNKIIIVDPRGGYCYCICG
jgi:hypothetical protein